MNVLDLFAGAGGSALAAKLLGWKTVCAVEKDPYCQASLLARQGDRILEPFPIWDDVTTFSGKPWNGFIDIVTAGFPCQPFSVAGRRKGKDDERNLWPDTIRIIRESGARVAFLENVPGLLSSGYFGTILRDLAESGFCVRWRVLSAAEVGAPHKRDRLWILAYRDDASHAQGERAQGGIFLEKQNPFPGNDGEISAVAAKNVVNPKGERFIGEDGNVSKKDGRQNGKVRRKSFVSTEEHKNMAKSGGNGLGGILREAGQGTEESQEREDLNGKGPRTGRPGTVRRGGKPSALPMANANDPRKQQQAEEGIEERDGALHGGQDVADAQVNGLGPGLRQDGKGQVGGRRSFHGGRSLWWVRDPADEVDLSPWGIFPDTDFQGLSKPQRKKLQGARGRKQGRATAERSNGPVKSRLGRVAHGVAGRVDRITAIGGGWVPSVAAIAYLILSGEVEL